MSINSSEVIQPYPDYLKPEATATDPDSSNEDQGPNMIDCSHHTEVNL